MGRTITILGATGSIGRNTLDVVEHLRDSHDLSVEALTGSGNVDLLAKQAIAHRARLAVTADPERYRDLKQALAGSKVEAAAGPNALVEAAERPADWVMSSIVGIAGLAPTLAAVRRGAAIALAYDPADCDATELQAKAGRATLVAKVTSVPIYPNGTARNA